MRLVSLILLAALAPLASAQDADSTYAALVAQVRGGDVNVDYTAMRMAYAETEAYSPYAIEPKQRRSRMFQALFEAEDAKRALAIADSSLDEFYADIDAHLVAGIAHRQLGDEEAAGFHFTVMDGLTGSILDSGDGLRQESPYVVISTSEEYALLRVSGLQSLGQGLVSCAGAPCDRLEVEDPETGETFEVFFDVSLPMGWMNRELSTD